MTPSFAAWPNRSNTHTVEQGVLPLQQEELRTDIPRSERVNGKAPYSRDPERRRSSVSNWVGDVEVSFAIGSV